MEVKKSSITSSARSCRTVDPRRFWELQVSACVLVFRGVTETEPHDMQRPLVLRPGMGMEKRKLNRVRHWTFEKVVVSLVGVTTRCREPRFEYVMASWCCSASGARLLQYAFRSAW
jgi:hypothetical protein